MILLYIIAILLVFVLVIVFFVYLYFENDEKKPGPGPREKPKAAAGKRPPAKVNPHALPPGIPRNLETIKVIVQEDADRVLRIVRKWMKER